MHYNYGRSTVDLVTKFSILILYHKYCWYQYSVTKIYYSSTGKWRTLYKLCQDYLLPGNYYLLPRTAAARDPLPYELPSLIYFLTHKSFGCHEWGDLKSTNEVTKREVGRLVLASYCRLKSEGHFINSYDSTGRFYRSHFTNTSPLYSYCVY